MKKLNVLTLILLVFLMLCSCGIMPGNNIDETATYSGSDNVDYGDDIRHPPLYGTSLNNSYTDNSKILSSKDGKIQIKVGISNVYAKAEYGFVVFVDGVSIPFRINENNEEKKMHIIAMEENEKDRLVTVELSDKYFPANTDVYVSISTILNPDFMIKSSDYINYLPHHALAAYNFYIVRKDEGEAPSVSVSDDIAAVYPLPEEINSMYEQRKGTPEDPNAESPDAELSNSLDNTTVFLLRTTDNFTKLESGFACEKGKDFNGKIACIGKDGSFRLSLYINHKAVPAFDGCEYVDIITERDELKVIDVSLSKDILIGFEEYNSIYLIAVPLNPTMDDEIEYVRPIKTTSQVFFLSEDAQKVNEFLENFGYLYEEDSVTENPEDIIEVTTVPDKIYAISTQENINATTKYSEETSEPGTLMSVSTTQEKAVETTKTVIEETSDIPVSTTEPSTVGLTQEKSTTYPQNTNETDSDLSESYSTEFIRDVWSFQNGAVLVQCKDWSIHIYDTETETIKKDSVTGGYDVKKLDNGIAVINTYDFSFKIYDCNLKLINQGKLPYSFGDEVAFTISSDGKSIIYCVNEGSKGNNVYISSIDLNSKKSVRKLSESSAVGDLVWIDEFLSFDGEKALFYGSYIQNIVADGFLEQNNCFGIINSNGAVKKQNDTAGYNSYMAKGENMLIVDIAETDGKVGLWSLNTGYKQISLKNFQESYGAFASENCKYIATQAYSSSDNKLTVRIYDYSTMTLLYNQTFTSSGRLDMDFSESDSFAYIVNGNKIVKVCL